MTRRLAPLVLAALLPVLLAWPACASASSAERCSTAGVTLAATPQVRVSSTDRGALGRVSACGLRTGKVTQLGDYGTCDRAGQVDKKIVIVGKRFAVSGFSCPGSAIVAWVKVYDANTGKGVTHDAVTRTPTGADVDEQVTSLVLARDGAVAWIGQLNRGATVRREVARARPGGGVTVLDRGSTITACSLTLAGSALRWFDRDVLNAATL